MGCRRKRMHVRHYLESEGVKTLSEVRVTAPNLLCKIYVATEGIHMVSAVWPIKWIFWTCKTWWMKTVKCLLERHTAIHIFDRVVNFRRYCLISFQNNWPKKFYIGIIPKKMWGSTVGMMGGFAKQTHIVRDKWDRGYYDTVLSVFSVWIFQSVGRFSWFYDQLPLTGVVETNKLPLINELALFIPVFDCLLHLLDMFINSAEDDCNSLYLYLKTPDGEWWSLTANHTSI